MTGYLDRTTCDASRQRVNQRTHQHAEQSSGLNAAYPQEKEARTQPIVM